MWFGKGRARRAQTRHLAGLILAAVIAPAITLILPVNAQQETLRVPDFDDAHLWGTDPSYWKTIQFPDINGDGLKDVCGRGISGVYCALNNLYNTGDFGPLTLMTTGFSDALGWKAHPSYWATIRFPDLNGDRKADVCGRAGDGIYCALSTGTSFGRPSKWDSGSTFSNQNLWNTDPSYWETIQFPDFNGDGKADVCGRGHGQWGNSTTGIVCAESDGTRFGAGLQRAGYKEFSDDRGWNINRSFWGTIRFVDVNGDGRADVCGRASGGIVCALSIVEIVDGFGKSTLWSGLFSDSNGWNRDESNWGTIQYADINGDRKADVCGRGSDGLYCGEAVTPVSGAPFFNTGAVTIPLFSDANRWSLPQYYKSIRLVDVNGDFHADACGRASDGIYCALAADTTVSSPISFPTSMKWISRFGDNPWGNTESYWGTVQPADVDGRVMLNGDEWCGRGPDGLVCFVWHN